MSALGYQKVCMHCRLPISIVDLGGAPPFEHSGFHYHEACAVSLGLLRLTEQDPKKWGGHKSALDKRCNHLHLAIDFQTERVFRSMVEADGVSLSEFFSRMVQAESARRGAA